MIPDATLMRDVLTKAADSAKGALMLSSDGGRDLFGEALHMIGVSEEHLRDSIKGSYHTVIVLGALTVYLESGVMWDRGKKEDALQWARLWAARRTVGDIRHLLMDAGITIDKPDGGDCNAISQ